MMCVFESSLRNVFLLQALQMLQTNEIFEKVVQFVQTEQNLRIIFNTLEGSYALCLLANLVHLAHKECDRALPKLAFPEFNVSIQLDSICVTIQSYVQDWTG